MSQSLFSRYSSFLRLRLWLPGNELPARISSAFTAIPLPTIKGYLDNQSANSSRRCLLVGAMKDYMSPWLAVHLTPQGSVPIGTRKSDGAIRMLKEGPCVWCSSRVRCRWGGGVICVDASVTVASSLRLVNVNGNGFQDVCFSVAISISLSPGTYCL